MIQHSCEGANNFCFVEWFVECARLFIADFASTMWLNTVLQSQRGSSQALPATANKDQRRSADLPSGTAHDSDSRPNATATSSEQETHPASVGSGEAPQATESTAQCASAERQPSSQSTANPTEGQDAPALTKDSARQFADEGAGSADQSSDGRTAHFASLAEQADIRQVFHMLPPQLSFLCTYAVASSSISLLGP